MDGFSATLLLLPLSQLLVDGSFDGAPLFLALGNPFVGQLAHLDLGPGLILTLDRRVG